MGLSARTDDNTGLPLGEGFITYSTSAGNALLFRDPASANQYVIQNPGQFNKAKSTDAGASSAPDGDFNTEFQQPAQS